jgi:hypothetical protein
MSKLLIRVFPTSVEGATPVVSFVEIPIIKLMDVSLNEKIEKMCEDITVDTASESLHNLEKLGQLQEGIRGQLMYLHRDFVKYRGELGITRKPEAAGEEISENNNLMNFGNRSLLTSRGRPSPEGKNPASSYSLISSAVTLDLPKTKAWGHMDFEEMSPFRLTSTLEISSPSSESFSDLISPSSRLPDSRTTSAGGLLVLGGAFSVDGGTPAAANSSVVISLQCF